MVIENKNNLLKIAVPSKGELERPTLDFLAACGLRINRPNERQYVASIPSLPGTSVLFQRVPDILIKVEEGSADIGITGFDVLVEYGEAARHTIILYDDLGYGQCELVLAVPENWVDVTSIDDLYEVALLIKQKNKDVRIATKYPNSTKKWLYEKGILHFSIVEAQGALEAAPSIGYADMISDITATGTTLRENRLKKLTGGTILKSQACLVGNRQLLSKSKEKLETTRIFMEFIEAHTRAKRFLSINANIQGASPDEIVHKLLLEKALSGLRGPTISKVYGKTHDDDWYMLTIVIEQDRLMEAIDHLRDIGGTDIIVSSPNFYFDNKSIRFDRVLEQIKRERH